MWAERKRPRVSGWEATHWRRARALQDKPATDECFEKKQMMWKGMSGRSWSALVQQWGMPEVESLQLQKSIAAAIGRAALKGVHMPRQG